MTTWWTIRKINLDIDNYVKYTVIRVMILNTSLNIRWVSVAATMADSVVCRVEGGGGYSLIKWYGPLIGVRWNAIIILITFNSFAGPCHADNVSFEAAFEMEVVPLPGQFPSNVSRGKLSGMKWLSDITHSVLFLFTRKIIICMYAQIAGVLRDSRYASLLKRLIRTET